MCVEDIAYCPYCGFQRTMYFQRCKYWALELQAFNNAYPSNCLSDKQYPSPKDCQLLARNLKMEIRPGACPRGPLRKSTCAVESEGSFADEEEEGCPGYDAKAELREQGPGQWEKVWGHRVLRWRMGLPQTSVMDRRMMAGPGALQAQTREDARVMAREIRMIRLPRHAQELEALEDADETACPEMRKGKHTEAKQAAIADAAVGRTRGRKQRRIQWAGTAHQFLERDGEDGKAKEMTESAVSDEEVEALGARLLALPTTPTAQIASRKGNIREALEKHKEHVIVGPPVPIRVRHFNGPMERPSRHGPPAPAPNAPVMRVYGLYRKEESTDRDVYNAHRSLRGNW